MKIAAHLSGLILVVALARAALAQDGAAPWHFAVSGDSRNCGDVIMPAIAAGVKADHAEFYWHLGDLRAIYGFDEDMVQEAKMAGHDLTISDYQKGAWPDFIRHQIAAFDPVPFYLAIGNHELIPPKTRPEYVAQFADWLDQPTLRKQRLADDHDDHMLKTYFHWIKDGIDFISVDNASTDMFDDAQLKWIEKTLRADTDDKSVRAIVIGMHEALPHSLACDHSMDAAPQQEKSGEHVYRDLLKFRTSTKKAVYVLSSHSHFFVSSIFDSEYWRANGGVLPGWIIGTAGAIRYRLPAPAAHAELAKTDVSGYLLATVNPPGQGEPIAFQFREITRPGIPADVVARYGESFVNQCLVMNQDLTPAKTVTCDQVTPCDTSGGPGR